MSLRVTAVLPPGAGAGSGAGAGAGDGEELWGQRGLVSLDRAVSVLGERDCDAGLP